MAFTRTWNASYEASPANGDNASEGALRIREIRIDVRERMAIDHSWAGDADDGKHTQITFVNPLGSDPTNTTDEGYLYTKDVTSKAELFWEDEDGNVIQLTSAGAFIGGSAYPNVSNDQILIRPDATIGVATGWSTESITNKAVRINSSALHNTSDGGTVGFTTVFGTARATTSDGTHSHTSGTLNVTLPDSGNDCAISGAYNLVAPGAVGTGNVTGSTASGGSHSHTSNLNVDYTDFRIVSKD